MPPLSAETTNSTRQPAARAPRDLVRSSAPARLARIGYLIPEFPGQTHVFLWRERQALARLGVETAIVSTRPPPPAVASHAWGAAAAAETAYLWPPTAGDVARGLAGFARAGPRAWARCARAALGARGLSASGRLRVLAMIPLAYKLIRLARAGGWSHVHVHSCGDAANLAALASLLAPGITYSLTLHGPRLETYGANQPAKWRHARFALVVSERLLESVRRVLHGSLPPVLKVAPMGVDLDRVRRAAPYAPWGGAGPCRIFSCGRLNPVKGHAALFEVVRVLRGRGIDARLQIAGEDEAGGTGFRRVLERQVVDAGLSGIVELPGALSEDAVRAGLEAAHLFALASLDEGVPVAVMEAMAMEVPAVVTDVGGARELIDPGRDAALVLANDPAAMADEIERLLHDPATATRMGQAARRKVASRFHAARSAEALVDALRESGVADVAMPTPHSER